MHIPLVPTYTRRQTYRHEKTGIYFTDLSIGSQFIASAASNNTILLHDLETLQAKCTFQGHTMGITGIQTFDDYSMVASVSKDKSLRIWDSRATSSSSPHDAVQTIDVQQAASCLDINDNVIAVGTELVKEDAYIKFWDLRKSNQPVQSFEEAHADDLTVLRFHPIHSNVLISGSTDGLLNIFDLSKPTEDDAIQYQNQGESIHKLGYFGPNMEYIFCLTHIETFTCWDLWSGDLLGGFGDVRGGIYEQEFPLHYCVDCTYDTLSQRLYLWGGSREGDITVWHVNLDSLCPAQILPNDKLSHNDIVRSIKWVPQHNVIYSAGEDSKVCLWTTQ